MDKCPGCGLLGVSKREDCQVCRSRPAAPPSAGAIAFIGLFLLVAAIGGGVALYDWWKARPRDPKNVWLEENCHVTSVEKRLLGEQRCYSCRVPAWSQAPSWLGAGVA